MVRHVNRSKEGCHKYVFRFCKQQIFPLKIRNLKCPVFDRVCQFSGSGDLYLHAGNNALREDSVLCSNLLCIFTHTRMPSHALSLTHTNMCACMPYYSPYIDLSI
jgi:hypothetical protein